MNRIVMWDNLSKTNKNQQNFTNNNAHGKSDGVNENLQSSAYENPQLRDDEDNGEEDPNTMALRLGFYKKKTYETCFYQVSTFMYNV